MRSLGKDLGVPLVQAGRDYRMNSAEHQGRFRNVLMFISRNFIFFFLLLLQMEAEQKELGDLLPVINGHVMTDPRWLRKELITKKSNLPHEAGSRYRARAGNLKCVIDLSISWSNCFKSPF